MGSCSEPSQFLCLTLERMRRVAMTHVEKEIEREERESVSLVLPHVYELVTPQRRSRLDAEDDDVTQRDRDVAATRQDVMRETAVADIEEASVAEARLRTGEPAKDMTKWVSVMRDQLT